MAYTKITAAGTYFLKDGAGYIRNFSCTASTSMTLVINDLGGPAASAPVAIVGGTTPFPLSVGSALTSPINFNHGCQLVIGGSGELDVDIV
jgi:hypothetical protein